MFNQKGWNDSNMSEYKSKIIIGAVLAVIIAIGLAGATIVLAPQTITTVSTQSQQSSLGSTVQESLSSSSASQQSASSSTAVQGAQSVLIVQLTDPPIVPPGTTSLNLTYTAMDLLVTEPVATSTTSTTTSGTSSSSTTSTSSSSCSSATTITSKTSTSSSSSEVASQTIAITPTGGSATVDLLKLQNISQTLASASLPTGSTIYSVTFVVSSTSIDIDGTVSPVTLTSGSTLLVALTTPAVVRGTVAILLDLNPTIIDTSSGYQMIPSSIGVIQPSSEITNQDQQVGYTHQLTDQDQNDIKQTKGQVTASVVSLSVSGSTTNITIKVSNTGCYSATLESVAVIGNFTTLNCPSTTTTTQDNHGGNGFPGQQRCESLNQVVFFPSGTSGSTKSSSSSTTTTSSTASGACATAQMTLGSLGWGGFDDSQLVISPGQCVLLAFSGTISYGPPSNVLVPSTLPGQTYTVQVVTSNSVYANPGCMLPFSQASCQLPPSNNGRH
jgi:hypothetical protein